LTLIQAIDICGAQEVSSQQLKSLKSTDEHSVHAIKQVRKVKPKTLNYRSQNQSAGSTAK
jgi:hypothetical protein